MNQDYKIIYIRVLATAGVVLLHILQKLSQTNPLLTRVTDWLNLCLVLFFVISAFLYAGKKISFPRQWYIKRYLELIVPSVVTVVCTLVIYQILIGKLSIQRICEAFISGVGGEIFLSDGWLFVQLWFLSYILVSYLTVPIIQKIKFEEFSLIKFILFIVSAFVILQLVSTVISKVIGIPFFSASMLMRFYLPYAIFKKFKITSPSGRKIMNFGLIVAGCLIIVSCIVRYTVQLNGSLLSVAELLFINTQTIAGIVLFCWLYVIFSKVKKCYRLIQVLGKYSYSVYLTHCLFIGYSTSVIDKFDNVIVGIVAALACTAVASFALYNISTPLKNLLLRKINKFKTQI